MLEAINNTHDSGEEVKISTWTGPREKLIPNLMYVFEGFKTLVEEVTQDVVKKTLPKEELLIIYEHEKWFLEIEAIPEEIVKIAELTKKDLEYYTYLVGKAMAGFEKIDFNSERSSTVGKILSDSIPCYREIVHEMKSPLVWQPSLLSSLRIDTAAPNRQQPPSWSVSSHPHRSKTLLQQKDSESLKA